MVLKGTVATEHDKRLIERMAKLEPGIDQVQNDLAVGTPILSSASVNASMDTYKYWASPPVP